MTRKKNDYHNPVDTIDTKPPRVKLKDPVEPDKFDRHMRKARRDDINSRRRTFVSQSQADSERDSQRSDIASSIY